MASYNQAVATYRQTVLAAFVQVEDDLAALRVLSDDIQKQGAAVQSAERNLGLAMNRYEAGLDPYLNVISAQAVLLGARQVEAGFQVQQMVASVELIEALGGGWDASRLPSPRQIAAGSSGAAPSGNSQTATGNSKER